MVITGKSYGTTNLIALDRRGAVLVEASIVVQGPEPVSVVYFGMERETYSCTPKCERQSDIKRAKDGWVFQSRQKRVVVAKLKAKK
jgi:hypothetical protein